ncbi:glycosyltransferase family 4 protein [Winogradskyella algicola]|uniref:glycosyltransferase family 4 protein n=1 Tax=Winogradskyella algicola TaxID=2575815 RepID=UPI001109FB0C|nr:glycosyltransferase family 4 protein [Winogradskyella algicola]
MKIDFLVNSLVPGGAERVLVLLANFFKKQGHDVTIITFNEPEIWKPDPEITRARLHDGKIKNHMVRSLVNLTKYYSKKKNRPDVLISFMIQTNLIGILVSKLYRIKVIASEHNNHLKETDRIGRMTRKYFYRLANKLTVLTHFDKIHYDKLGVDTYVMPNPCTFDIYEEEVRKREKIILAVGALNRYHHKGFDNLIKLIAPILKKHKDWKLKLVGGGTKGTNFLKALVDEHNIQDKVIFTGFSTEVSDIMKKSDIYIMTSRWEGLPMVLIEAMSQGLVCISYDCKTGPSEIIENETNGILVEDQNIEEMSLKLEELINNPDKRNKLAKAATESLDRYDISSIYDRYMKIINSF